MGTCEDDHLHGGKRWGYIWRQQWLILAANPGLLIGCNFKTNMRKSRGKMINLRQKPNILKAWSRNASDVAGRQIYPKLCLTCLVSLESLFPKILSVLLGASCCSSQCFSPVLLWVQRCWKGSSASLFDSLHYVLSRISETSRFSQVQQVTVCSVKLPENKSRKKVLWFLFMTFVSQQDNVWCRTTDLRKDHSKDISLSVFSDLSNGSSFSLPKPSAAKLSCTSTT